MTDREDMKYKRIIRMRLYFIDHLATISASAPAITPLVNEVLAKFDEMTAYAGTAMMDLTGYTVDKTNARAAMQKQALRISGGMRAYFLLADDENNAERAHLTKNKLHNSRQEVTLYLCETLLKMAQEHLAEIAPFGVTAAMLTDLETYVEAYKELLVKAGKGRKEKVTARRKFSETLSDCDRVINIISSIMEGFRESDELLYLQYKMTMKIGKPRGGNRRKPDFEETLSEGEVAVVADFEYSPKRSFRVRNRSKVELKWGLSESDSDFTNKPHKLDARATSQKLSSTLASKGNFLVFENLSDKPAVVQVWVEGG